MEQRLKALREQILKNDCEAFLITYPMNRRYMTGFTGSSGFALVTQHEAILITDGRYSTQSKQEAPHWSVILHDESIMETVGEKCRALGITSLAFEAEHLTYQEYLELREQLSQQELIPTTEWIESLRMVKSPEEIQKMQKAAQIVDRTFQKIIQQLRPGITEQEVAFQIEKLMRQFGASGPAFETIVASGERSALPHGLASDKVLEKGDLVLMDFGAYYQGYTSDITRTVVLGTANQKQREIYEIVLSAQKRTIEAIASGRIGKEVDAVARKWIAEHGYDQYFRHATGHGIGMEVHESPALRRSSEEVLKTGMIVTVEPGIYLPYIGGVRIEDDILVTPSGGERLTQSSREFLEIHV